MAGYQDRRLEALESALPERPSIVVLSGGTADAVAGALEAYYAANPDDEWAELVVIVRW